jgi:hypothetical protein
MNQPITPTSARDRLIRVARAVNEGSEPEAVSRFLEKLTADPDAEALRDALVVAGAAAVLRAVRC